VHFLCVSGGILIRFMSPSTRIIGGTPDEQVQVGGLVLDGERQQLGNIDAICVPLAMRQVRAGRLARAAAV